MSDPSLLQLDRVSRTFRRRAMAVSAVNEVSFELATGDFLLVRGPSGAGKSTLLLMLGGMLRPSEGNVFFQGKNVYDLNSAQRARWRRENVGFVFQQIFLLPYLSVRDNILLARPKTSKSEVDRWLDQLQLRDRSRHRPSELSVGEQQRVALIRALICKPALVLADEPISHLDEASASLVVSALDEYRKAGGAVVMVTHHFENGDLQQIRTLNLRAGSVIEGEVLA